MDSLAVGVAVAAREGEELLLEVSHRDDAAGDADVIAEDEATGGSDERNEEDGDREAALVLVSALACRVRGGRHFRKVCSKGDLTVQDGLVRCGVGATQTISLWGKG